MSGENDLTVVVISVRAFLDVPPGRAEFSTDNLGACRTRVRVSSIAESWQGFDKPPIDHWREVERVTAT